jgi:DNA topoisomerase I
MPNRELGKDPASGKPVQVKIGRFGPYVQIGTKEDEDKPRFAGIAAQQEHAAHHAGEALELFKLPRELGETPDGLPVLVNIGRFGPFVKYGAKYASLKKDDDPYTIGLERALEIVRDKEVLEASRTIREFPEHGIRILKGRFGPYATDSGRRASIPKGQDPARSPSTRPSSCWTRRRRRRAQEGGNPEEGRNEEDRRQKGRGEEESEEEDGRKEKARRHEVRREEESRPEKSSGDRQGHGTRVRGRNRGLSMDGASRDSPGCRHHSRGRRRRVPDRGGLGPGV